MTKTRSRDLDALRDAREARRERSREKERALVIVGSIALMAFVLVFFALPAWAESRETRRYEAARAAVDALLARDRSGFEARLVDGAPPDAYAIARKVVSIVDPSFMQRGHVGEDSAGVVTAEGYEIVVPLTDDLRVVPDLSVRADRGIGFRWIPPDGGPIAIRSRAALEAVFTGDREAFEALLPEGSADDVWAVSREAIEGLEAPDNFTFGWSRPRLKDDDLARSTRTFHKVQGARLRVAMQRIGNRWFVDGPITRTR